MCTLSHRIPYHDLVSQARLSQGVWLAGQTLSGSLACKTNHDRQFSIGCHMSMALRDVKALTLAR